MANLVNAYRIGQSFGTRTLLDGVSLGLDRGDVVGVVGRNGGGKTTLLRLLTRTATPDTGQVTHTGTLSIGYLEQAEAVLPGSTVRSVALGDRPDHTWAADAASRAVVTELLGDLDLDAPISGLSGGERRRTGLAQLLLGDHDLLVLDEPTNHLDVEAVDWLARHLQDLQRRQTAMLVVSHDRWFLDAICSRIWEVHDGVVDGYDGGYAAYTLARAERARQAAGMESRRQNLLRKELAWLRRGPPARTSKPQFRIDAANTLIEDEPPPRDQFALQRFATSRLGKDVFDLHAVDLAVGEGERRRVLLDDLTWSIGPGDRIGLVGVNGSGKTTLLRLLAGQQAPDSGTVKQGRTLSLGYLSQTVTELPDERVLASVAGIKQQTTTASGREMSATSLLEEFGFTGDRLTTRTSALSGGERRRLQLLRLLLAEPNVLLLDEPTNDLDIDTLNVVEDYLDGWPGTLLLVSHDRYFLERVCDVTYALMGDGSCVLLPGGVEQYLAARREQAARAEALEAATSAPPPKPGAVTVPALSAAASRSLGKEVAAAERRLGKLASEQTRLHHQLADHDPADVPGLLALADQLREVDDEVAETEERWLELSERLS